MAWYDRKENSTGALCARLSGDASKETSASWSNTRKNFFPPFYNLSKNQLQVLLLVFHSTICPNISCGCRFFGRNDGTLLKGDILCTIDT
jgi:hypothetical protein